MFCIKCGNKLSEDALFCDKCGYMKQSSEKDKVLPEEALPTPALSETPEHFETTKSDLRHSEKDFLQPPINAYTELEEVQETKPRRSKKIIILAILIPILLVVVGTAGFLFLRYTNTVSKYDQHMKLGEEYMKQEQYDRAVTSYKEALQLKPDDFTSAQGLARAYMHEQQYSRAHQLMSSFSFSEDSKEYESWDKLMEISKIEPKITSLDTSHFPDIKVNMTFGIQLKLGADNIQIEDGGGKYEISDIEQEAENNSFSYTSTPTDTDSELRNFKITIKTDDFIFENSQQYSTPQFKDAVVSLVSTDTSDYPKVKMYFRIVDAETGIPLTTVSKQAIVIQEKIKGGAYLAREVREVSPLEDKIGLNINLATDKSGSIEHSDMDKIKNVMEEFVHSLQYDVGDRVEILAFDSIVQQMCYYTNNVNLLENGINNITPFGRTALYDAIYMGINHSALQGGARCVITFTDGRDNESRYTVNEIINYSNRQQVPVYIIGVGSDVDTVTLTNIADSTGGRYWHIDDLYDLEEIYNTIYFEQKQLFLVEYESDVTVDRYIERSIILELREQGYRAQFESNFTPVKSIYDEERKDSAKYELIKENLTWEEASQRCQEMGGHLATISSQHEMDLVTELADNADAQYIWLGGYTSYDERGKVYGHWVTGEPFDFAPWAPDEPSRVDEDGVEEWYIMLWDVQSLGGWTWNDQRNDPAEAFTYMEDNMAFICEFED